MAAPEEINPSPGGDDGIVPVQWKANFWRNTGTFYIRKVLRIGAGLVMFRLLFQHFSAEQFGYWSFLWSVLGYTILMDFGMGLAAQRESARRSTTGEWEELSRLLSTTFWTYVMFGALILVVFFLAEPYFLHFIHVSPHNRASFGVAYWIFFVAMGINFPLGLFPEMVAGLQRLDLFNWISIVGSVVNVTLVWLGVHFDWAFQWFVLIGVGVSVTPNIIGFFLVRRLMPRLSLSPRLYHFPSVKGILSFSLVAYMITLTQIVISKTDQAVISFCMGVALVTIYQAGYKVSEMFAWFTCQMEDALSSAAAHLKAKKDEDGLRRLVVRTTRLTALVALPAYLVAAVYLESLIALVTGLKVVDSQTLSVGQMLLFNTFSGIVTSSCSKRIMLVTDWERALLKLSVIEALTNLLLSIILVRTMGVVGVAIGTLIPGILIGWLWVVPLTLRFTRLRFDQWLAEVFGPLVRPVGISVIILLLILWLWPVVAGTSIFTIGLRCTLVMLPPGLYLLRVRKQLL